MKMNELGRSWNRSNTVWQYSMNCAQFLIDRECRSWLEVKSMKVESARRRMNVDGFSLGASWFGVELVEVLAQNGE